MSQLHWPTLRDDLLYQFRPADYRRMARKKLKEVRMGFKGDVNAYINKFNVALNRCDGLPASEALFLFEEGLSPAVAL